MSDDDYQQLNDESGAAIGELERKLEQAKKENKRLRRQNAELLEALKMAKQTCDNPSVYEILSAAIRRAGGKP